MIFTRRFGALRARPVFPAVTEQGEQLDHLGEVRSLASTREARQTDESAA
jgi:hypothetical protein